MEQHAWSTRSAPILWEGESKIELWMCEICRKKRLTSYSPWKRRGNGNGGQGRGCKLKCKPATWEWNKDGLCREEEPQGNPARPQEEHKPGSSDPGWKPPPHLSYWEELSLRTLLTSLEVRGWLRSACDVPERGLRGGLVSYLVAVIKYLTKVT